MGTLVITGATGTVGSEVVRQLAAVAGVQPVALVRDEAKAQVLFAGLGPAAAVRAVDYADGAALAAALADLRAEKLFLLTPLAPDLVEQSRRVVDAAKAAGVRHVVKLSGLGADAPAPIQLGRWHRAAEQHLEASGLSWTHLRPNAFMQNFQTYHGDAIRIQNAFFLPHGDGACSYVDVRDVAAAAVAALTGNGHEGHAYNLTGPAALTGLDIARHLSRAAGRNIVYVETTDEQARAGFEEMEAPPWMADALMELNGLIRRGLTAAVSPDLPRLIGRPALSFETYARDHAAAWAEE